MRCRLDSEIDGSVGDHHSGYFPSFSNIDPVEKNVAGFCVGEPNWFADHCLEIF